MGDLEAVQPLAWMRAVRDSGLFTDSTLNVLLLLGLRMRKEGEGFASQRQLAADAGVSESTARRALRRGREAGYVEQTRRGHRVTDGTAIASEYRLIQPVTGARLEGKPTGHGCTVGNGSQPVTQEANRSPVHTQPVTGDRPRGLPPEVFSSRVLSLGDRSPTGDVPSFSETEIVNLAARILGAEHDIDEEELAALWDAWNDATPAQKAWARGQARNQLRRHLQAVT